VHLPIRSGPMADLVRRPEDPAAAWHGEADSLTLPWALNPSDGLLASANNRPTTTPMPVGFFFPGPERVERLYELLRAKDKLSIADLASLQQDTLSTAALALKTALVERIKADGGGLSEPAFTQSLAAWDGRYEADSPGPVFFETLLYHLALGLYAPEGEGAVAPAKSDWKYLTNYLVEDLDSLPQPRRASLLSAAVGDAADDSKRFASWGEMHRMRIGHILANFPVLGPFFTLEDYGVGGSRNTIFKTAHGLSDEKHSVGYGSEARQLSDLSDPDANWFVLLGGQDGWLGSQNFADEVALWREGRSIRMPLRAPSVASQFPAVLELKLGSPSRRS
jgi:penicillin amidase